ncbi:conserved hypothetical protein [Talaromyces stipitatus ATCC 10500]|uniref:Alpha/beta hydrolase fold-3 domain-containing protein n=1 Tax=Talaromyces stipitatus (strain ATCC 10500 / CBS 375.48 / QM 6759 / NRRL 1006) TaxID=441959 RepID=B8LUZ2_TALSN|nr:uncharacterized protein TSTA_061040 [Talaromyces stipitatus ATCC 10500]EED22613.1 conserved hypothetical protein [Talaromyces stipitatus ATCC 10500]
MDSSIKTIFQPLEEAVRKKLDPEYVKLHDDILQYCKPSELEPWDAEWRFRPNPIGFASPILVEVGNVVDISIDEFQARVFTPETEAPAGGWPCFVYYHGGGWVLGGLNSENGFLRHICKYLNCTVVSINYRHAPEHCYPVAIEDSLAGLKWILALETATRLSINTSKIAIGGLSAGGGLAAIVSMQAALDSSIPDNIIYQILICPVIDNTATVDTAWATSKHSPWLTPSRMTWYRNMYFQSEDKARNWDASPCFAPAEVLEKSPSTFIAIAECDLLAPEARQYGESLQKCGVAVEIESYSGATHSILILAGYINP